MIPLRLSMLATKILSDPQKMAALIASKGILPPPMPAVNPMAPPPTATPESVPTLRPEVAAAPTAVAPPLDVGGPAAGPTAGSGMAPLPGALPAPVVAPPVAGSSSLADVLGALRPPTPPALPETPRFGGLGGGFRAPDLNTIIQMLQGNAGQQQAQPTLGQLIKGPGA